MTRAYFFLVSLWLKYFDYLRTLLHCIFPFLITPSPLQPLNFYLAFVSYLMEAFRVKQLILTLLFWFCQALNDVTEFS